MKECAGCFKEIKKYQNYLLREGNYIHLRVYGDCYSKYMLNKEV